MKKVESIKKTKNYECSFFIEEKFFKTKRHGKNGKVWRKEKQSRARTVVTYNVLNHSRFYSIQIKWEFLRSLSFCLTLSSFSFSSHHISVYSFAINGVPFCFSWKIIQSNVILHNCFCINNHSKRFIMLIDFYRTSKLTILSNL